MYDIERQALPHEVFTAWNSFSRIGVTGSAGGYTWSSTVTPPPASRPFDWDRGLSDQERFRLLHEGHGFPYILRPPPKRW